jgi:hypothetical protein
MTHQKGYQQALDDFGVSELLKKLNNFSDSGNDSQWMNLAFEELDSIAAMLIGQLTASLKVSLISAYLKAIQYGDIEAISDSLMSDQLFPQVTALPIDFSPSVFQCGDYLRWKPLEASVESDFGVVIGRFYLPAPHRGFEWSWKYLIMLDFDSPSAAITVADTAWEDDLEPREKEEAS